MEEQNARTVEVKSHRREVRKPVMREDLPVEEIHVYPEGIILTTDDQAQTAWLKQLFGSAI